MQLRDVALVLAAATTLALASCNRGGAGTGNPNAPGSPGTGNASETSTPVVADTKPGGPSGVKGSLPHPDSSGGDAVLGTTGTGNAGAAQPGTGLQGGLGNAGGMSGTGTGVADGSTNSTSKSGVGNRP